MGTYLGLTRGVQGRLLINCLFDSFSNVEKLVSEKSITPGPGHYLLKASIPDVPEYAMMGREPKNDYTGFV